MGQLILVVGYIPNRDNSGLQGTKLRSGSAHAEIVDDFRRYPDGTGVGCTRRICLLIDWD